MSIILSQGATNDPNATSKSGLHDQPIMTISMDTYQCQQIWPDDNVIGSSAGTKFLCEAAKIVQTKNYPNHVAKVFKKYVGYNVIVESLGENTGKFNVLCFTDKGL